MRSTFSFQRIKERERERETYICDLRLHVVIFTTIYYNIYDMREREGGRQMHITILYYIIYAHIKFAFDSFISKNTRERERERERERDRERETDRQREKRQTFII